MRFDLTEDQREIRDVARGFLRERAPIDTVRADADRGGGDPALWRDVVELGWPGIAVAEEHGGQGLDAVTLAVLLEEAGLACLSTPLASTATVAAVLQACGTDEQRATWLPRLTSGEVTAGLGVTDLVVDGPGAAVALLLDDEPRLVIDPDVAPVTTVDPTRPAGRMRGGRSEPLPAEAAHRARTAIAAELVGVGQRALDLAVAYAKDREQFGRPIGAFQAVAHRCARMLLEVESGRSTVHHAAWAADADRDRLHEAAALAAASAAIGAREATAGAIQVHGGIGFTWEADLHWLYKRAQVDTALLGGIATHRRALGRMAVGRG
ncbi:MAG: acyl-CoA/acyl-ACP dehydrogenase [Solirubrobacteraceae bacterium]|nr:acyl-CoA/acyl-ACP dehydrogenase [Solirubrobacteraceae bacterium]